MKLSTQEVNNAKAEVKRLKKLKIRFANDPEAQEDLNTLINKHVRFIEMAQQRIEANKIVSLC